MARTVLCFEILFFFSFVSFNLFFILLKVVFNFFCVSYIDGIPGGMITLYFLFPLGPVSITPFLCTSGHSVFVKTITWVFPLLYNCPFISFA